MSEYEITVHVECSHEELAAHLERYAAVLTRLEANAPQVREWLAQIGWPEGDSGFVAEGSAIALSALTVNDSPLVAEPYILGYASSLFQRSTTPWLQCSLVFEYDSQVLEVGMLDDLRYRPEVSKPIYRAARAFAGEFAHIPVFFNDFASVNRPWKALLGEDGNLWTFDLAIVPPQLATTFANLPAGYARADLADGIALAPIARWSILPWSEGE